jgi:large subunit ribosomal protein L23
MPDLYSAVVVPLVTEKSSAAYAARKEYTFRARPTASKHQIRAAIESLFGVHVVHIRTLVQRARRKTRGKTEGIRPRWKKAFVRLKDGESIEIFEG